MLQNLLNERRGGQCVLHAVKPHHAFVLMGCGADMSVPIEESSLQMVIYLTAGSAFCEFCENSARFLEGKPYFSAFSICRGR